MNLHQPQTRRARRARGIGADRSPGGRTRFVLLNVGRGVTLTLLAAAPWFYGCIRFVDRLWLFAAMVLAFAVALVAVWLPTARGGIDMNSRRIPWLVLPFFAAIALGATQLLPVSQTLQTSETMLARQIPELAADEPFKSSALSFYPEATRREIAKLVFAAAAFLTGYVLFRSHESQRVLWATVACNGVVLTAFGMTQKFSWNGKMFWEVPLRFGGQPFASFVNRNNSAAYLLLALAAALGFALWTFERTRSEVRLPLRDQVMWAIARLDALHVSAVLAVAVCAAGIIASGSRGGFLAMACAGGTVVIALGVVRKTWLPLVAGLVTVLLTAGVAGFYEFSTPMVERFANLKGQEVGELNRIRHWQDAFHAVVSVPVVGAGLGTHRYAHLPFVTDLDEPWFMNADNQFMETLVEAGIIGCLILLLFLGMQCRAVRRLFGGERRRHPLGMVLLFILVAESVHAIFDFGIILPATLLTACVLIGAAVARVRDTSPAGPRLTARYGLAIAMTAVAVLSVGSLNISRAAARTEAAQSETEEFVETTGLELDELISQVDGILKSCPHDAELHRRQAALLMKRYRDAAIQSIRESNPALSEEETEERGSVPYLAARLNQLRSRGRESLAQQMQDVEIVETNLVPAQEHLKKALAACPILPRADLMLAQLAPITAGDQFRDVVRLRLGRAVLLEPCDPATVCRAALLKLDAYSLDGRPDDFEAAAVLLQHALRTREGPKLGAPTLMAVSRYAPGRNIRLWLPRILPTDPQHLLEIGMWPLREAGFPDYRELRAVILNQALQNQGEVTTPPQMVLRATIVGKLGHADEQLALLSRAVEVEPGEPRWRYEFAVALRNASRFEEAREQASAAASLAPSEKTYEKLVLQLNKEISANRDTRKAEAGRVSVAPDSRI